MNAVRFLPVILAALLIASAGAAIAAYPSLITGGPGQSTTSSSTSTLTSTVTTTMVTYSTTTTLPVPAINGTLDASIDVGPTQPVCRANSTTGPYPPYYSVELQITPQSGAQITVRLDWLSNGCDAFASTQLSLAPGAYSLNLTNCNFVGCHYSLPRAFTISSGRTTTVQVSIDTGIR